MWSQYYILPKKYNMMKLRKKYQTSTVSFAYGFNIHVKRFVLCNSSELNKLNKNIKSLKDNNFDYSLYYYIGDNKIVKLFSFYNNIDDEKFLVHLLRFGNDEIYTQDRNSKLLSRVKVDRLWEPIDEIDLESFYNSKTNDAI